MSHNSRKYHRSSASEIGGSHISSSQRCRSDDDRLIRIQYLYLGSQIFQLVEITESSFIERLKDFGDTGGLRKQGSENRLEIRRESWENSGFEFCGFVFFLVF